ncbi:MAG: hypothetical protein Q7K43_04050, partial [Candidatus Woesearchaeota archaeon]|nr:hypothetical protein [Candidatus Woesearchaeota archaeon]
MKPTQSPIIPEAYLGADTSPYEPRIFTAKKGLQKIIGPTETFDAEPLVLDYTQICESLTKQGIRPTLRNKATQLTEALRKSGMPADAPEVYS